MVGEVSKGEVGVGEGVQEGKGEDTKGGLWDGVNIPSIAR